MRRPAIVVLAAGYLLAGSATVQPQPLGSWTSKAPDGPRVSFGLLAQPMASVAASDGAEPSASLCFRRLRFIGQGQVTRRLTVFIESDSPHLGVHSNTGFEGSFFLQDLIVSYKVSGALQVDGGLLLIPLSYNSNQSAASLLPPGYGPYSFLSSEPTDSTVGRDYGAQVRGYLAGGHLEYRAGAFRGATKHDGSLPPRWVGRAAWHVFEAQTGAFYAGTSLGGKRLMSIGASVDRQQDYAAQGEDFFLDQPLAGGGAITFQVDYIHYDGGATFASLPRQHTWLLEAGYLWRGRRVGAYTQLAWREFASALGPDAASYQGGVIYWARGHRLNLKTGVGVTTREGAPARVQAVAQTQIFAF